MVIKRPKKTKAKGTTKNYSLSQNEPNQSMKSNKDIGPLTIYNSRQQVTKKQSFESLDGEFLVWKRSSISLLPNCPKEAQRSCTPHLFSFSPNKEVMPS